MTFKEKIDKILKTNKLGINSIYGLESYIGAAPGAVNKYYKKSGSPGHGTVKKILDGLSINPEWWEEENGSIYLEKPTMGIKSEQADILDSPLVRSFKEQIELYKEMLRIKDEEIARLKGQSGK